ncbi:hypothetical protein JD844_017117 [Phrynosoma platyrhinos]|uniref:Cadherin domain-containing protein n=1 Tax=Phrynosoma platyrhinos TaxID=52577 RepID=A0ABQ7SLA0_PHRPL|nr:hypothetical protein JD844_017117 [Phrynosoma platyrhinos]
MEDCFRNKGGRYIFLLLSVTEVLCVSIHYSVPEEKKSGSLVANVLKDLKLGIGELSARRAQLVSKSSKEFFHLDVHSGNLLINEKIDREALCGQIEPCLLLSQIVLQNPLKIYSIEMKVEDVNDNAPKFSTNDFQLEIPENVLPNTRFPLESAQDEDLRENSIQNYTLSPNEYFHLVIESKNDVHLILMKALDREREPQFGLTLIAVDGGVPQRTGTVHINITVLDINDNSPQFTQSEYKVKLKENCPQNTLVSKVEAKDLDYGSNAHITYSFHRMTEKIHTLFHLNERTGEITVLGEIDYEKETNYDIKIKAIDGGGLSGYCSILVEIEDVNDNAPKVSIISVNSPLPEDSLLETLVALFSVTDEDSGDNGKTVCSVTMNLPFILQATANNLYKLVIQSPLDRERISEYNVTITAMDLGSPRLTSARMIQVQISDVNDNTPVFEKSLFEMQMQENNIPGLLIGSVHAVDLDVEQNAKLTYSLLPGKVDVAPAASYISINSETGNIYAVRSLDYEQIKDFKVTVRATDSGTPPLTSDVAVLVVIADENDNAPFFLYPLQNSTSPCNELLPKMAEAGYLVTKVVAVDRDSGQNSWLSYELLKATDPGLFSIGAQNGEVKTRRPLTERDSSKQRLIIAVRDNGVPPQTSTATLNVLLVEGFSDPYLKVVDVHPQEHEDEGTLTMYLVICLASVSSVFLLCIISFVVIKSCKKDPRGTFIAAPPHFPPARPDIPENCTDSQSGSLSRNYQYDVCLTGGSLSSEFRFLRPLIPVFSVADPNILVNHNTSLVSQDQPEHLADSKSREQCKNEHNVYEMNIRATDGGGLFTFCKVILELVDENNNAPEDLKLRIGELSVRRAQLVSKSSKQYFLLDNHSGNLLINEKMDREALCGQIETCLLLSQIVLQSPLKIYNIEIKIEDVNDNAPKFSKDDFWLEIPETVPPNTRFPLETAQDEDLGENSIQNYTLSPNEHFSLSVENNIDGNKFVDLILEKPLDREKEPHFGLTLMAVDGGIPQRTGTIQININILDNNDNFPQFIQSEYKVRLKENSPRDTLVSKVEARDLDFGSNAQITYSFHRAPEKINNLFHLNEMTGEITVLGEIDYEKEASYDMNIKATDGGGLSGHCKVLVEVEDMNDNVPEVSVISNNSPLPEDSPLETLVVLFSINDKDSGENGRTLCSVDMNLPFALKMTGNYFYQLVIQSPLDREKTAEYNVTITATDQGSPRLTSTRIIHVQIADVNDNSPVFKYSSFEMQIQENNIPGLLIGSVHALDLDVEQNAKLIYSLLSGNVGDSPVASYISVNSETGNMYVLRSLDYEEIKDFKATVRATDSGTPPLSSDAIIHVIVIDENDNAPFFLYPLQNSTSPCNELLPKMAETGYLVTKVVAVDRDSGQNSWLSYELLKATDPGLFSIGAQNGEIKIRRPLTERDTSKQKLIIAVRDSGATPQTSTATLNILLVDGFSDPYLKVVDVRPQEHEDEGTLTMYLMICLASVSFVFLLCIASFVAIKMCKKEPGGTFIAAPPHFPPARPDIPENCTDSQSGSLSRNYQYDVCLTGGSLSSEFRFLRPLIPVFSVADPNISVNYKTSSGSQDVPECLDDHKSWEQVRE